MTTFRGTKLAFGMMTVAASLSLGVLFGNQSAQAQTTPNAVLKPFALKLGVYNPSEPEGRRLGATVMFAAEAEYTIENLVQLNGSYSVLTVGYTKANDLQIVPVTLGQMWTDGRENYFYGFGFGLYNVKSYGDALGGDNKGKSIFGLYGTVGLNLTKQVFMEAKYQYPYKYNDQFIGGLQIMGGYRF